MRRPGAEGRQVARAAAALPDFRKRDLEGNITRVVRTISTIPFGPH